MAWAQSLAPETSFVPLRMGHQGLFVERLDRGPVSWDDPLGTTGTAEHEVRLDPLADSLVLVRNRALLPRLGRFLQPDPHATGTPVQASLARFGTAMPTPTAHASLGGWTIDGTNVAAYLGSDPINRSDPTGLFFGFTDLLGGASAWDAYWDYNEGIATNGGSVFQSADSMLRDYALNQMADAHWALDWSAPDWDYSGAAREWLSQFGDHPGSRLPRSNRNAGSNDQNSPAGPLMAKALSPTKAKNLVNDMKEGLTGRGVYVVMDKDGNILYVGRSSRLDKRMDQQEKRFRDLLGADRGIKVIGMKVRGRNATRGLEQLLIDALGTLGDEADGRYNKINGVSPSNKKASGYGKAAWRAIGRLGGR